VAPRGKRFYDSRVKDMSVHIRGNIMRTKMANCAWSHWINVDGVINNMRGSLLIIISTLMISSAHAGTAKVICPDQRCGFGPVNESQIISHKFIIRNDGTEILKLAQPRLSCGGCTSIDPFMKDVPPGRETELVVHLNLKGMRGEIRRDIWIQTNDPVRSVVQLYLEGIVTPDLQIAPRGCFFGHITAGDIMEREVIITNSTTNGLSISKVECSSEYFGAQYETLESGVSYRIIVKTKKEMLVGNIKALVAVRTDRQNTPIIEIPVYRWAIGSPPSCTPGPYGTQLFCYDPVKGNAGLSAKLTALGYTFTVEFNTPFDLAPGTCP
jgi:hypothetical protein